MPRVGEVNGADHTATVSVTEAKPPAVTLWSGLESTDLAADQADQLAAYLRLAAARACR